MKKILSMFASIALCSVALNAAGTASGTTVSNSASLSYSVGGATQPTVNTQAAATFVVDKKIDFSVVHADGVKHLVTTPGASKVQRSFTLENTTNSIQDFTLLATNLDAKIYDSKTDNAEVSNLEISIDGGTTWTAGSVTVDDLAVDGSQAILVRADVPNTNVDGNVMNIQLEATAVQNGTATAEVVTGGAGGIDRKDEIDVVLAEGAGVTDFDNAQFDGKYAAWAGYIINAPTLTLAKSSCVYKDLVSGVSANAKRIPGSTITYLLDIENGGSIDASDINITDTLPLELDMDTVTAVNTFDNQASCSCIGGTAGGGTAATFSKNGQELTISSLTALTKKHNCVTFQIDIQ
ncbi:MAG: Unknown protein [uncultured Sulfurovum sp.]|uniref:Uncharacterized protein n=1 Tax=uncultured Sulfurovum sp. TaxID=269237 RepID=A0A6S6T186_9BACT|nr:MAG: Unknown protein [uncultured Sulfurovum sp.]